MVGKNTDVIVVSPPSANNSTEATSIISVILSFLLLVSLGEVCLAANSL
jgi:hypothetical protein